MATCFATTAMAAEPDSEIPENATRHTIELTVNPDGTLEGGEDGISPFIWNQENHTVSGDRTYTLQFNVPERYFAYEMRATATNGNALSGYYMVELLDAQTFGVIASYSKPANGNTYKVDHIDLYASNERVLFCISMAYSICDMICILFFCPFQQWMMKNKCCGTCRIYNWDFIMMFTPMIFIPSKYNTSLFIVSLILFINWEVLCKLYPERFHEETNMCLSCVNCEEKLCRHKKTLQKYLKKYRQHLHNIIKK